MFRSFVCFDQEALANYSSQLGMSSGLKVKAVDGSLGASVGALSANVSVRAKKRTMKRSEGLEIVYEKSPENGAEVVAIYH